MQTQSIKKELLKLERKYWQAIKDKDMRTAVDLTDDPCLIAGAQGVASIDKKKFLSIMKAAPYSLKKFSIKNNAQVRLLSPDVAILAYQVHEELTVDGKSIALDAAESSTWVKRDDRWLCAMHSESLKGDPFGRK